MNSMKLWRREVFEKIYLSDAKFFRRAERLIMILLSEYLLTSGLMAICVHVPLSFITYCDLEAILYKSLRNKVPYY